MDAILAQRVEESLYYKQNCFGLNAATLLDRSMQLTTVGNLDLGNRPLPFACLLTKVFALNPEREIVEFYVEQTRFKYLRLLGLLYHRLKYRDYTYLKEKVDDDYRKIRICNNGHFYLSYMDECIDQLVNGSEFAGFTLPEMERAEY